MKLNQLRHFIAAVDNGSIRQAARRLGLSSPALTKSIKELEGELKVELLHRTTRGIVPTLAGRSFYARATAVDVELRNAVDELAMTAGSSASGEVTIGIGQTSGTELLPAALRAFRARWPNVRVQIIEGFSDTLLPRVYDRSIDFLVGAYSESASPNVIFKPLFTTDRVIVARKDHPLVGARSIEQLALAEWLSVPPLQPFDDEMRRMFAALGATRTAPIIRCNSYHIAVSIIATSDFLSVMSKRQMAVPLAAAALRIINVRERLPPITVGLYVRADGIMTTFVASFAQTIASLAQQTVRTTKSD